MFEFPVYVRHFSQANSGLKVHLVGEQWLHFDMGFVCVPVSRAEMSDKL